MSERSFCLLPNGTECFVLYCFVLDSSSLLSELSKLTSVRQGQKTIVTYEAVPSEVDGALDCFDELLNPWITAAILIATERFLKSSSQFHTRFRTQRKILYLLHLVQN